MIGAHYTSSEDILLLIEPVVMAPLLRRWAIVKQSVLDALAEEAAASNGSPLRLKLQRPALQLLQDWAAEITRIRILDPACGSGTFSTSPSSACSTCGIRLVSSAFLKAL